MSNGFFCTFADDFVVVNPTTIIVIDLSSLYLLRLCTENGTCDQVELVRSANGGFVYVITDIKGANVCVEQAVLQYNTVSELRFVRLDIDLQQVTVERVDDFVDELCVYHLSNDGRLLYGVRRWLAAQDVLHVLDIRAGTWRQERLAGAPQKVRCLS